MRQLGQPRDGQLGTDCALGTRKKKNLAAPAETLVCFVVELGVHEKLIKAVVLQPRVAFVVTDAIESVVLVFPVAADKTWLRLLGVGDQDATCV